LDLTYTAAEEEFRASLREFLDRNVPLDPGPDDPDAEFDWLRLFQRRMYAGGWCGIHWPKAFGGREATPTEQAIFVEEMARARAPQLVNRVGINNVGPTIMHYGTEAQKQRWLPGILSAEEIWCQLYSEPDAGSDLASLRTRAVVDGDGWRVSGQKVWTSYAQHARWGILLARTDPAAPQHRGISYFILDMHQPGIEIRPLRQLDGSVDFNEVFLEEVWLPADHLIGECNRGWQISTLTLAHERGTNFAFKEQALAKIALEEILEEAARRDRMQDPVFRQAAARLHTEVEIMRLLNLGTLTRIGRGEVPGAETSIVKEHWSRLVQDLGDLSMQVLGAAGQLRHTSPHSPRSGRFVQRMLFSRAASIAGGTSEIQKNIIAQRLLGLPRT
jgi:alkylation response protein AidB-like acyl-CoA dehydrogenase